MVEINSLPTLLSENISSLGGPRHESFIKEWNGICGETNCRNSHLFCAGEKLTVTSALDGHLVFLEVHTRTKEDIFHIPLILS